MNEVVIRVSDVILMLSFLGSALLIYLAFLFGRRFIKHRLVSSPLFFDSAMELWKKEHYTKAIRLFKDSMQLEEVTKATCCVMVARCYKNINNFEESEKFYQEAIDYDRGNVGFKTESLVLLRDSGRRAEYEDGILKLLELYHLDEDLLSHGGFIYFRRGEYKRACEVFDRLIHINSTNTFALRSLAQVMCELGDYDGALSMFNKAILLGDSDSIELKERLAEIQSGQTHT